MAYVGQQDSGRMGNAAHGRALLLLCPQEGLAVVVVRSRYAEGGRPSPSPLRDQESSADPDGRTPEATADLAVVYRGDAIVQRVCAEPQISLQTVRPISKLVGRHP